MFLATLKEAISIFYNAVFGKNMNLTIIPQAMGQYEDRLGYLTLVDEKESFEFKLLVDLERDGLHQATSIQDTLD